MGRIFNENNQEGIVTGRILNQNNREKNTQGKNSQWEMFKNNNKSSHRKNSQSEYFFLNDKNQEPKKINVPSECWPSPCWHRQEHPHGPEGASVPAEWLRAAPSCGSWAVPPPPCLGAPCAERSGLWGERPWNQPTSFRIAGLCYWLWGPPQGKLLAIFKH